VLEPPEQVVDGCNQYTNLFFPEGLHEFKSCAYLCGTKSGGVAQLVRAQDS